MNVLVINCGSSSVKYQFLDTETGAVRARGFVERIGFDEARFSHAPGNGGGFKKTVAAKDHTEAVRLVLDALTGSDGVVADLSEIGAVGHRFVHGGSEFREPVLVSDEVLAKIRSILDIAPLHNPANLLGIEAALDAMPDTPQAVVFDTSFHFRLKPHAYHYALPYRYYEQYGIRRYGFHGISHYYVSRRAAELSGRPVEDMRIITCHLGNGASIDAVKNGWAVDTSMGYTPQEGLIMGTRAGDVDSAAILHIMKRENLSPEEMDTVINKESGIAGFTGQSPDMRELNNAEDAGDERAIIAQNMYAYRIKKYISAYFGVLGGLDALVFTAGVGEHSPRVRARACEGLSCIGIEIDAGKNEAAVGGEHVISLDGAPVTVYVIPTNEEIVIAREAGRLAKDCC